MKDVEIKIQS